MQAGYVWDSMAIFLLLTLNPFVQAVIKSTQRSANDMPHKIDPLQIHG